MPTAPAKSAAQFLPEKQTLADLSRAAETCKGCDLYLRATQTVFGSGRAAATLMLVGEQPGDQEDQQGEPFVGPAGHLLDRCLEEASIDRGEAYVTNIVKHFKWEPRGKRRIHEKPNAMEIAACKPWFEAEVHAVKPKVIVCLGATAAQALLGKNFRVTQDRGKKQEIPDHPPIIATVHPSSILRSRTDEERHQATAAFIVDLKKAAAIAAR